MKFTLGSILTLILAQIMRIIDLYTTTFLTGKVVELVGNRN